MPSFSKEWFYSDDGYKLLEQERLVLGDFLPELHIPYALQLGMTHVNFVDSSAFGYSCYAEEKCNDRAISTHNLIYTNYLNLPFGCRSLNMVVLPHTLDVCSEPFSVLHEVSQIITDDGYLFITGFNPYGIYRLMSCFRIFPSDLAFFSPSLIQSCLKSLGFEIIRGRYLSHIPSLDGKVFVEKANYLRIIGERWFPTLGGAYLIMARKSTLPLNLTNNKTYILA